jgi:hypothetical protein
MRVVKDRDAFAIVCRDVFRLIPDRIGVQGDDPPIGVTLDEWHAGRLLQPRKINTRCNL